MAFLLQQQKHRALDQDTKRKLDSTPNSNCSRGNNDVRYKRNTTNISKGRSGGGRRGGRRGSSDASTINNGRSGSGRRGSSSNTTTISSGMSGWSHFGRIQGCSTSIATFLALGKTDCHTDDNRHKDEHSDDYDGHTLGCAMPWRRV